MQNAPKHLFPVYLGIFIKITYADLRIHVSSGMLTMRIRNIILIVFLESFI